jgi:hypothetical protein
MLEIRLEHVKSTDKPFCSMCLMFYVAMVRRGQWASSPRNAQVGCCLHLQ